MLWLAVHMWVLLLASFGVGLAVGWWIWGQTRRPPAPPKSGEAPLGTLELDEDAAPGARADRS